MSLFATAAAWLTDALEVAAGVPVTYRRPPALTGVPITALVPGQRTDLSQPGQPPIRVVTTDRDYLIRFADLAAAGLFPPQAGDRVTEFPLTFVAAPRAGLAVWEWGEPERVTVRVRCTEKA